MTPEDLINVRDRQIDEYEQLIARVMIDEEVHYSAARKLFDERMEYYLNLYEQDCE